MEAIQIIQNNNEITEHEKIGILLNDISKAIKQQLKEEYPGCKFSIRTKFYSGGQSLSINIMKSNFKVILPIEEITQEAILRYVKNDGHRTLESLKEMQLKGYHQLSSYTDDVYNKNKWNNGTFLTEKGYKLVKRIGELSNKFNWDNSNSQIDNFDVKF